jgi:hypothetical protein
MTSCGVRSGLALALFAALLTGCATAPPRLHALGASPMRATVASVPAGAPVLVCHLDLLRWSHGFVARVDERDCVAVLESVRIGD